MAEAQEKRALYMKAYESRKEEIDARVKQGIEKYRKGYCKLRFTDENGDPIKGKKIKLTQTTHDFKYGANLLMLDEFKSDEDNAEYRRFFKEHFNAATVPFYWDGLEPDEGAPRYDKNSKKVYRRPAPELCMEYCNESGISPKLHCLVYDKFVPDWLKKLPLDEVKAKYEERIRQISDRYNGRMFEFEVINEALEEKNWNSTSKLSEERDIIEWSFATARKYMPEETLVINETNQPGALAREDYRNAYFLMVENALLKGATIDKIGIQHHMFNGADTKTDEEYEQSYKNLDPDMIHPFGIWKGLDVMASLGLPLEITEVTIPTFGNTPEDEQLQADLLKISYSAWFSHPAVETIVYWNTVDGYAYSNDTWDENKCRGGLWHHDLTPKKSADMIKKLFSEIWHTDLELTTDDDGYVEFRGFYGDYIANIGELSFEFGIHKNENNCYEVNL